MKKIMLPLVVTSIFLGGCDTSDFASPSDAHRPAGKPWISVEQGDAPVDPDTLQPVSEPGIGSIPASSYEPAELPPLPEQQPEPEAPDPDPEPKDPCIERYDYSVISPLNVTPGKMSAVISWDHPIDPHIQDYRVAYISQDLTPNLNTDFSWQKVEPSKNCGKINVSVNVPYPGSYVFVVDVVRKTPESVSPTTTTVARSPAILVEQ